MRFVRPTVPIAIFFLMIFSQRLYAQDIGDWDNVRRVLNQRVEVYYGTVESRSVIILSERIVGLDKYHMYTSCIGHSHKHDKKLIRAIIIKRKTFPRILSLFLLSKEEIIYLSKD